MVDLLAVRARAQPSKSAYTFLADGEVESASLSYLELDQRARAVAAQLRQAGAAGRRVLLLYPPGLEFVVAFLGCLCAGAVAVPAHPPRSRRTLPRLRAIAGDSRPALVLTEASKLSRFESLGSRLEELRELPWLATDQPAGDPGADDPGTGDEPSVVPGRSQDQLAFLQYTSGSTATPRGVRVTHGNLSHNLEMIRRAFGQTPDSIIVGWLPLYHDMGLVGNVLQPLWAGARCILMSPAAFLHKPLRWLEAISRYQATTSGGPNFAYELCASKAAAADLDGLDLSSWQVAFNGSEPVRAETLERFARAFEPCGFRNRSFFPCYGLAEATLLVSGGHATPGAFARVVEQELERGRVVPSEETSGRALVGCKNPELGHRARIVNPESGELCAEDRVGEIWLAGPSVADGYWNRPAETERSFGARLAADEETWMRTGDLGFFRDDHLFVTGRLKDLIILRGRNLYPQDVEWTAENSHPAIRAGCCAAFSVDWRGEERLVIAGELERRRTGEATAATEELRRAVGQSHEAQVHDVVWVRFGTMPKTSSGKIRRRACRAGYLGGTLRVVDRHRVPAGDEDRPGIRRQDLLACDAGERPVLIEAYLRAEIAHAGRLERQQVEPRLPLVALGVDSLAAAELRDNIETDLEVAIPLPELFDANLEQLASQVLESLDGERQVGQLVAWPALRSHPEPDGGYPLSHGQRALWFLNQLAPASPAYNLATACRIRGGLDPAALGRALESLVARHPMLRMRFETAAGEPRQRLVVSEDAGKSYGFTVVAAADWSDARVRDFIEQEAWRPFDLARGPLLRVAVLKRQRGYLAVVSIHHIVADFRSLEVMVRELGGLYSRAVGDAAPAEALGSSTAAQYSDWVRWQEEMLAGAEGERLWRHWRDQLDGVPQVLELTTDRPRLPVRSGRAGRVRSTVGRDLRDAVRALAQGCGATLYMTLLSAFQALLQRYTGQPKLVVGTPAANRRPPEIEQVFGYFVNPMVLVADFSARPTGEEALRQTRATVLEAFEHQDYPFPLLAERLQPVRDPSLSPLFQAMFVLEATREPGTEGLAAFALGWPEGLLDLGPLVLESVELSPRSEAFDLTLTAAELDGGLAFSLHFDRDLFDGTTARRMLAHFESLLAGLTAAPTRPLAEVPLMPRVERAQLLVEWNDAGGVADPAPGRSVPELFEAQARRTPEALALGCADRWLTYRGLDRRAEQIAGGLRRAGVGPEQVVGLCAERSVDRVAGILGIWKAGGVYLPLDASYPIERLAVTLAEARAEVLLAGAEQLKALGAAAGMRTVPLDGDRSLTADGDPPAAPPAESLAYVTYTSGSTGTPKGVAVEHRALARHLTAAHRLFGLTARDRILQFAAPGFDVALEQTFAGLLVGATVLLGSPELDTEEDFLSRMVASRLTVADLPPAFWQLLFDRWPSDRAAPRDLRWAISGGDAMTTALAGAWSQLGGRPRLLNAYGPTEGVITATAFEVPAGSGNRAGSASMPIGHPLPGRRAYVLDRGLTPLPVGLAGELTLGGPELARGYFHRPYSTARAFVPDPFSSRPGARLYRTGDLARWLPGGGLEWLGRIDRQVKLRGFRIELGDVEAALNRHPRVERAAVVARGGSMGQDQLIAYLQAGGDVTSQEFHGFLADQLPAFMLPARYLVLDALPVTADGTVDRRALPAPGGDLGQEPAAAGAPPRSRVERRLATIWKRLLGLDDVGLDDSFFELGGHSLLLIRAHREIVESFGQDLTVAEMFRYPTLRTLAQRLSDRPADRSPDPDRTRPSRGGGQPAALEQDREIAIVGLACRVPGAGDSDTFWRNLRDGVESIQRFSARELRDARVPEALLSNPAYVPAAGVLPDIDRFDASFFGYSPRQAATMDPQHRLFLEAAWEALENAGHSVEDAPGPIGVFAGLGAGSYWLNNLASGPSAGLTGDYQLTIGNEKDFLPTRVSYKLNLRGPSVNVQTACSTSLVAVHMACQSLLLGECDLALAGGVSIKVPHCTGYLFEEDMILSPDGHCRAFDAAARGTVIGNGLGIVVLKRLAAAIADGDTIHAVIKGSAINNDGSVKVGFTAPSAAAQEAVIVQALATAGVEAETIDYVEAHGTGTPLGDPIEIAALKNAFGDRVRERNCAIGSVKTNLGHLDAAAGIAGLIKAVLALKHQHLPPSLHFERANPELGLEDSPFEVQTELGDWPAPAGDRPRRAGVSSFGIGGTNAHVVLEEAPAGRASEPTRDWQLLVLSGKSRDALERSTANLASYLERHPQADLANVAFTLQTGRWTFPHRRCVIARDPAGAADALAGREPGGMTGQQESADRPVAFLFPGQGAQHVNMARGLYRSQPIFRRHLDRCCELLIPDLGFDLRLVLYSGDEQADEAAARLQQTAVTQPALFAVEYALARLWMAWGVRPQCMLGHSIGEYVAACLAGVFSLEDALALVAARASLMQELPPGAMLSVPLSADEVRPRLTEGLSLAASNGPDRCVVSGPTSQVDLLADRLTGDGVSCRRLEVSHAFHSAMMAPMLGAFTDKLAAIDLAPPRIPYLSNLTGTWIEAGEATDPAYWARHLCAEVRYSQAFERLLKTSELLLEVGPGQALSSLARRHPGKRSDQEVLASLPHARDGSPEDAWILKTLGRLWLAGLRVDWQGLHRPARCRRLPLPTYPFERRRHWIEAPSAEAASPAEIAGSERAGSELRREQSLAKWFYAPSWKRVPAAEAAASETAAPARWLIFADECGLGHQLVRRLAATGAEVVSVQEGEGYAQQGADEYRLDPGCAQDYETLLAELARRGRLPRHIVHLWSVTDEPVAEAGERAQDRGFYSLLFLAQALAQHLESKGARTLTVVANGLQEVTGEEELAVEKATLLGPCGVIPQEFPSLGCRIVDVSLATPGSWQEQRLIDQLMSELGSEIRDLRIAFRGNHRLAQTFERHPLARDAEPRLRERGVYLLTGGLGGLGLTLAEQLAERARARLILLGRSAFPAREAWDAAEGEVALRVARLRRLEELGAKVLVVSADVTDRRQMERVKSQARERFGAVHGIIHAAGVAGGGPIPLLTRETAAATLAPKVRGTLVLDQVFAGVDLDFMVLCSSLTASVSSFGEADYSAANAFLDAFAHHRRSLGPALCVSVGWDAWSDAGMAVRAVEGSDSERLSGLPLFDRRRVAGPERVDYVSRLSAGEHWVLREHKLLGQSTLPGTAYLEMARAAFAHHAGNGTAELRDVYLPSPCVVAEGEERETRTILERRGENFDFHVVSRDSNGGPWQEHARGSITGAGPAPPAVHRLETIAAGCPEQAIEAHEEPRTTRTGPLELGPRWDTLRQVRLSPEEGLAMLELAPAFSADLETFGLHPALMDAATGFLVARDDGDYLPFSYHRLSVRRSLPARIYSHSRRRSEEGPGDQLTLDVTLMDEDGAVLVEIEGYTLLAGRQAGEQAPAEVPIFDSTRARAAGTRLDPSPSPRDRIADFRRRLVAAGLSADEGWEIFERILGGSPPQILVSTHDLSALEAHQTALTRQALERAEPAADHPRPELSTDYVAPRDKSERTLAGIWGEMLGVEAVGVHDNFFELGGDSLLATQILARVRSVLDTDLSLGSLFERPTIAEQSQLLNAAAAPATTPEAASVGLDLLPPIQRQAAGVEPVLSSAQQRLWFLDRLEGPNAAYNMPAALRLEGTLDRDALARSLSEISRRHETLRTSYPEVDGQPVLAVVPPRALALPGVDLSALPPAAGAREAQRLAREDAVRAFDLASGPMMRATLLRLGSESHILLVTLHHINVDAWSMSLFVTELTVLYRAFAAGEASPLPELAVRYSDYAAWQQTWSDADFLTEQSRYWQRQLARAPGLLALPTDRPRPAAQTVRGGSERLRLDAALSRRVKSLGQRSGTSLFMTLLGAFAALLARTSRQSDLVIGSPTANRGRPEIEPLIGMFANTLALRVDLSADPTVETLLGRVREMCLAAYAHQDLPFERLVEAVGVERSLSHSPIFQVLLVLLNAPAPELELPGLDLELLEIERPVAKYDLTLMIEEQGEELVGSLEFNRDLFDRSTIRRLVGRFGNLLAAMATASEADGRPARLSELGLLGDAERLQLQTWSRTPADRPGELPVHQLFERQAQKCPDAIAVVFEQQRLSYRELDRRADALARRLRALGIGPDAAVGLSLSRSPAMTVAVLATLRAGGAYVPLDPAYPKERRSFMLADSRVAALVVDRATAGEHRRDPRRPVIVLDRDGSVRSAPAEELADTPRLPLRRDALYFIIYTSGSTGQPKGIAIPHRLLADLIAWQLRVSPGRPTTLQYASLSFDVSAQEMFSTWAAGGTLVLISEQTQRDPVAWLRVVREQAIERLFLPVVALRQLAELVDGPVTAPATVQTIITAGEQLKIAPSVAGLFKALPGCRLHNHYGPSESHVITAFDLSGPAAGWPRLPPIGRPCANAQVRVLEPSLEPASIGVPGEVCVVAQARGYHRRPALTAARFIPDVTGEAPGRRLYRIGDLARTRADGNLEFLGRLDRQVKVRGFRIEPAEIEAILARHPRVAEAAVIVREDHPGDQRLTAYACLDAGGAGTDEPDALSSELRRFLKEQLPEYMVPATLTFLDRLPLTPSGKVDRAALPAPGDAGGRAYVAPRDAVEEKVAGVLAGVLRRERLGVEDDFFDAGGNSLLATQAASRLRDAFGLEVGVRVLFEAPTVGQLAAYLADHSPRLARRRGSKARPGEEPIRPVPRDSGEPPVSYAQAQQWLASRIASDQSLFNLAGALRLRGRLDVAALEASLNEIVRRHEALRTRFPTVGGVPVQRIEAPSHQPLPVVDLSALGAAHERALAAWHRGEERHVFDLAAGPLLRTHLLRLAGDHHVLFLTLHHMVGDGWSLGVLRRELTAHYRAFSGPARPRRSTLSELSIQYADYACWQRRRLRGEVLEELLDFWRRQLAGVSTALRFPPRRTARRSVEETGGGSRALSFPAGLCDRLRELGHQQGASLFMVLLAAFETILYRFTGQRDFVVGVPVAGRDRLEVEGLIGNFLNVLALPARIGRAMTFRDLLAEVRDIALGAYAHQDLPFEKLLAELMPAREEDRQPLFQVVFNYTDALPIPDQLPELAVERLDFETRLDSKYEITLYVTERTDGLDASLVYDRGRFDGTTIEWLSKALVRLLEYATEQPDTPLDELPWLTETERKQRMITRKKRAASGLEGLTRARRRTVSVPKTVAVEKGFLEPGQTLPRLIQPAGPGVDLMTWVEGHRDEIESELLEYGAVLFRGFAPITESRVSEVAQAIAPELLSYVDGTSPRLAVSDKVYTSTEYPPEYEISMHNELSYSHKWPGKLFFYCVEAAAKGGETPLADSRKALAEMPSWVKDRFLDKGVRYLRNLHDGLGAGLSWQAVFETTDRSLAESYCREGGIDFKWREDGGMSLSQVRPAAARHPQTGEMVWFNQADQFHPSNLGEELHKSLDATIEAGDHPTHAQYGDGEPIPEEALAAVRSVFADVRVVFPWQEGDFLAVDNMLTAHGRMPFEGSRKVVVAMGAPICGEPALVG